MCISSVSYWLVLLHCIRAIEIHCVLVFYRPRSAAACFYISSFVWSSVFARCGPCSMQTGPDQSTEDDMTDGDLGNGMALRTRSSSSSSSSSSTTRRQLPSVSGSRGLAAELLPSGKLLRQGSEGGEAAFTWTSCSGLDLSFKQELGGERSGLTWRSCQATKTLDELSKKELRERLQEATQEAELLRCELEVTHRHLKGKNEALKILQGQAILEKATSHSKSLLQKSEERNKGLEKEVNALQWEITFNQVQFKNHELTLSQKYERVCSENKVLIDSLEERGREVQELRTENAALSHQCLELLSMLSVKEQSVFQGTSAPCSLTREATVLELAVLGACQCPGVREACSCARTAASSRKLILTLQQELEAQRRKRDEALMVADAFRIAFEQQLRKRSDHFLRLAETDRVKTRPRKPRGGTENRPGVSVSQRLRGMLPLSSEVKMSDDPTETLHRLLDLLNDKEEALAHQRKVSLMLARSAEELETRLQHRDSNLLSEPENHPLSEPAHHPLSEPAPHPLTEPEHHPLSEPAPHPLSDPAPHPLSEPERHPLSEPAPHPLSEPERHPLSEPAPHPLSEPEHHPLSEPEHHPLTEPEHHPLTEPEHHPLTEHAHHPLTEPGLDSKLQAETASGSELRTQTVFTVKDSKKPAEPQKQVSEVQTGPGSYTTESVLDFNGNTNRDHQVDVEGHGLVSKPPDTDL